MPELRLYAPEPEDGAGAEGVLHTPENPSVSWIIELFIDHAKQVAEQRSHADRCRILRLFSATYGRLLMSECKPAHLELWLSERAADWKSAWTQQRACATIHRPFNWAAKMGLIQRNPFYGVTRRPGDPGRPMEEWEFRRILRRSDALFRRALVFLRLSGARPGEASQLEWEHIDADRGVIVLVRHKTRKTQRQPKPRIIVLHPVLLKLLIYLRRHAAEGQKYVFINRRGNPWTRSSMALRMRKLRRICALPADCKIYGLRHGFATNAVENGVDLKTLAELLGHATTRMTEHYLHLAGRTKHLQDAVLRAIGGKASID